MVPPPLLCIDARLAPPLHEPVPDGGILPYSLEPPPISVESLAGMRVRRPLEESHLGLLSVGLSRKPSRGARHRPGGLAAAKPQFIHQQPPALCRQIVYHAVELRFVELQALVQRLISANPLNMTAGRCVVLDLQLVRSQIQHPLHQAVAAAHNEPVHHLLREL
jgi:hypothetical protein